MGQTIVVTDGQARTLQAHPSIADPAERFRRGASLGRYVILEQLGGGGMGVLYTAYDPQLDRKVAIKLLRPEVTHRLLESEGRTRLLREAQAMARLSHPNVVAVHDVGTIGDEIFIAMELVDGVSLDRWLRARKPGVDFALPLFLQAGRGLAAAHAAGIIHRDFKPHNVLVGKDGRVRVLDFGLAHAADEARAGEVTVNERDTLKDSDERALEMPLTRTGAFLGTPAFMAPEQLLSRPTDARSDQFSFCVALYEGVYGERPFAGDTIQELMATVMRGEARAAPPDSKVPGPLRATLLRGLRTRPEERFSSMELLLEALAPRHEVAPSRRWRWALTVVLVGLSALALHVLREPRPGLCKRAESRLAGVWDAGRRQTVHDAFLRTGLPYAEGAFVATARALDAYANSWLAMQLSSCEATHLRGEQSQELLDLRTQCLNVHLDELHAFSDLLARADAGLVARAATAASTLSRIDECADAVTLRSPVRRPTDPAARAAEGRLEADVARAIALERAGRYTDGLALAERLLPPVRALSYRPLEGKLLGTIARLQSHLSRPEAAVQSAFDGALAAQAGHDDETVATLWTFIVYLHGMRERYEEAHRAARIAASTIERIGHLPRVEASLQCNIGNLLDEEHKYPEAIAAFRRSIALAEELGPEDERLPMPLNNLGVVLSHQGQLEEAIAVESRALRMWERQLGPAHPNVAMALLNLGEALVDLGRVAEAAADFERALAIDRMTFGADSEDVTLDLLGLAETQIAQGRHAEALANVERVLLIRGHATGANAADSWQVDDSLAAAQLGLGRAREAVQTYQRALRVEFPAPRYEARSRFGLARALWQLGAREQARSTATSARAQLGAALPTGVVLPLSRAIDNWLDSHPR